MKRPAKIVIVLGALAALFRPLFAAASSGEPTWLLAYWRHS